MHCIYRTQCAERTHCFGTAEALVASRITARFGILVAGGERQNQVSTNGISTCPCYLTIGIIDINIETPNLYMEAVYGLS